MCRFCFSVCVLGAVAGSDWCFVLCWLVFLRGVLCCYAWRLMLACVEIRYVEWLRGCPIVRVSVDVVFETLTCVGLARVLRENEFQKKKAAFPFSLLLPVL